MTTRLQLSVLCRPMRGMSQNLQKRCPATGSANHTSRSVSARKIRFDSDTSDSESTHVAWRQTHRGRLEKRLDAHLLRGCGAMGFFPGQEDFQRVFVHGVVRAHFVECHPRRSELLATLLLEFPLQHCTKALGMATAKGGLEELQGEERLAFPYRPHKDDHDMWHVLPPCHHGQQGHRG